MASIALVLPLELGNPSFFGNDLQLVLGCVAFRFESAGIAIVVARAGGVGRPRRILAMAGVVAGARAGFH
jgi:hypothetical protein